MITDISKQLLESIHATRRCIVDVRPLAGKLLDLTAKQIELLLLKFVDDGDDRAVSVVLHASAMNQLKLDPDVLCQCIGVCVDLPDTAPCFAFQDANVVPRLLEEADSEALSIERIVFVGLLATELTIRFDLERHAVRKVLWKIQQNVFSPDSRLMIQEALVILDDEQDNKQPYPDFLRWTKVKLAKLLPEHRPKTMVGGTYTVRRSTPKVGRNEPCHCGSGKKYKKCCLAKDQALLSDASPYDGKTRTELKAHPGLVDDPEIIQEMRAYQLKNLKPAELGKNQLLMAFQRTADFGLLELSFDILLECERRLGEQEFDRGHFEDFAMRVFELGDLELAQKIKSHCTDDNWVDSQAVRFRFELQEHPERFKSLEADCGLSIRGLAEDDYDEPLVRLAYDFAHHFPALSIIFARAAIASCPDHELDNSMLLDVIGDARIDLDIQPWDDPAETLFDQLVDQNQRNAQYKKKSRSESVEIKRLADHLESTRADLDEKKRDLLEMQQMVAEVSRELEKAQNQAVVQPDSPPTMPSPDPRKAPEPGDKASDMERAETRQRLRERVERLKTEIGEQQKQRAQLRKILLAERRKQSSVPVPAIEQAEPAMVDETNGEFEPTGRPSVPEYSDVFCKNCDALPAPIAAKAILCAGRYAAHEKTIWQQTKPLKQLAEHYRIRIHRDYRMIVRRRPGQPHLILDVIPRQQLEAWIKRHL